MIRGELIFFVGLLYYVNSGSGTKDIQWKVSDLIIGLYSQNTIFFNHHLFLGPVPLGLETVWLEDITTLQTDKRTLGEPGLPAQLTFSLRRKSDALTLQLKRNYDIDPNADIYVVERTKDGRSILTKTRNLEQEDVAYYQDMEHGAYMTVRCVRRINHQCDRVINGNIQIGDSSYELWAAEYSDTSGISSELPDLIGKRYLLLDQRYAGQEDLVGSKVNEPSVQEELKELFGRINGQGEQNYCSLPGASIPSRNVGHLHDRGATDKSRQIKQNYYVKVNLLIDSGVWDIYFSRERHANPTRKRDHVKRKIREAYSHIINGVNLRYKSIEDPNLSITVLPQNFIFFLHETFFPHNQSKVIIENGTKYVDTFPYLEDLCDWDFTTGFNKLPQFDIAMLFTTHILYQGSTDKHSIEGMSYMGGVCDTGFRTLVIQARYYQRTVQTATHELGHSLGADHDGEGDAVACKSEDLFIMTNHTPHTNKERPYIRNMWLFSNCSVESFRKTLNTKDCLKHVGGVYNTNEWTEFMKKEPGDVFTPHEECSLVFGLGSTSYGNVSRDRCHLLRCIDPTGKKRKKYMYSANGVTCGENMWCIDGRCVSKRSRQV